MYGRVPAPDALVSVVSDVSDRGSPPFVVLAERIRAMPKSSTLTVCSVVSRMLPGLMSQ
jgi:hypothetical protein